MKKSSFKILLIISLLITVFSCSINDKSKNKTIADADILIENGIIITMNPQFSVFEKGTIVIHENKIIDIGNSDSLRGKYKAKETIDATDKLIMPGLINTHTHASMSLFRGYADDLQLKSWLYDYIFPLEKTYINAETVKLGAQLAIVEMIHSGTTTFNDMYFFEDEVARVCKQIGMRAVLTESAIDFPVPNSLTSDKSLEYSEMLINKYKNDSLVTIGVAAHSPYTCSAELLKKSKALADKYKVPFNIHLSETQWEVDTITKTHKLTPTAYLESLGILSENVIGAHCVKLSEKDIDIIVQKKVGVAHNPQCNMKLSSGAAPIPELLNAGAKVGLGTDGVVSNNNLDMFEEMNSAALLHKLIQKNPTVMSARAVIEMATLGSAKVLNKEKEIGSLEKGKLADIIILNLNSAHLIPFYKVYSQIVYSMHGSDVETVIINGKLIMKNNKILTINEQKIFNDFKAFTEKLKKEKNLNLSVN